VKNGIYVSIFHVYENSVFPFTTPNCHVKLLNEVHRLIENKKYKFNISSVSRECAVEGKVAEYYFTILKALLIAYRVPVFSKKAKGRLTAHPIFCFFDTGLRGLKIFKKIIRSHEPVSYTTATAPCGRTALKSCCCGDI
jgi:hypothetical protein